MQFMIQRTLDGDLMPNVDIKWPKTAMDRIRSQILVYKNKLTTLMNECSWWSVVGPFSVTQVYGKFFAEKRRSEATHIK